MFQTSAYQLVSRDQILKLVSPEQLIEHYTGLEVIPGVPVCNPFRADERPGCKFWYTDSGWLLFNDFARGIKWDCFDMVCEYYQCSFKEALDHIIEDFHLNTLDCSAIALEPRSPVKQPGKVFKPSTQVQVKKRKITSAELSFWQLPDMVVTENNLNTHSIYSVSDVWWDGNLWLKKQQYTFAYRLGVHQYQIYRPLLPDRTQRFRQSTSNGVYGWGYITKVNSYILITKSIKDWFLLQLLGFNAITVLTETHTFTKEELKAINRFPTKYLFYDYDTTGRKQAEIWSKQEGFELLFTYDKLYKDAWDYGKRYGAYMLQKLLNDQLINAQESPVPLVL